MPQPVETRVCTKCGEEKPITTFKRGSKRSGKCGACRYQEQLMRKRHGGVYRQGGDCVRRLFKLLVIRAYLLDLLPARTVVLAFRLFDLKHE